MKLMCIHKIFKNLEAKMITWSSGWKQMETTHYSGLEHSVIEDTRLCSRRSAGEENLLVKKSANLRKYKIRKRGGCGGELKKKHLYRPEVARQFEFLETVERHGASPGAWEEPVCKCRRHKKCGFYPWVGKTPLEEGMATHSSSLAWRIPWMEESGRLSFIVLPRVGHKWSDLAGITSSYHNSILSF